MQGRTRQKLTLLTTMAAVLVTTALGCRSVPRMPTFQTGPAAPQLLAPTSSVDQVIAVVNQNTARIHSYVTNNASISIPGLPHLPLLQGNIAFERPQRFRMQARALTGPEVDFGSNDERFWLWARQMKDQSGQSPLYTVRHDQYVTSGAQNMMPIEPQWIIEALGLVTIDPATTQPPTPRQDGRIELRSLMTSPRGQLTRILVIDSHGWVTEQSLVSPQGQLLASATAEQFHYDPVTQTSLPKVVTVRVPAAELALRINTGTVSLNAGTGDPNRLWQPPVMPNNPVVDLGLMQPVAQANQAIEPSHPMQAPPQLAPLQPLAPVQPVGWQQEPAGVDPTLNGYPPAPPAVVPQQVAPPNGPSVYQLPPGGVVLPTAG